MKKSIRKCIIREQPTRGAEYEASDLGFLVNNITVDHLSITRKITISKTSTTVIVDVTLTDKLHVQIAQLKMELLERNSVYDFEELAERIAKLSGEVAVIKGSNTIESELKALHLVPGGGAIHLSTYADERFGADIMQKVLIALTILMAQNGKVESKGIVEKATSVELELGYNRVTEVFKDMVGVGIKYIPSKAFSYYDLLDTSATMSALFSRYGWSVGEVEFKFFFAKCLPRKPHPPEPPPIYRASIIYKS